MDSGFKAIDYFDWLEQKKLECQKTNELNNKYKVNLCKVCGEKGLYVVKMKLRCSNCTTEFDLERLAELGLEY